ncbi:MAG TPA: glycosyltransferase [Acidimicrobiia bacterium]|nr:glycosyltransferase [Acidimicrobiia bacterium]
MSADLVDLAAGRGLPEDTDVTSEFIDLAQHHGLMGVLATESDSTIVTAIQARNEARQEIMRARLRDTLEALDEAGVRAAVIKGPAVAAAYRVPTQRTYSDLDLLVEESSLDAALETLSGDPSITIPEKRPKADKRDITVKDVSGVRFNLDLHWDLFDYTQLRGAAEGAVEQLWESASHHPDASLGPLWELPDWGRWSFLAAHSVLDHRYRLILFRDFVELCRHPVDWEELVENAGSWGLRSVTYVALWIGKEALGADIPAEALRRLRPVSETVTFLERQLPRVDIARFDGRTVHPVNLASVLLNDSRRARVGLAVRAPMAFPAWRRRTAEAPERSSSQRILLVVASDARRGAEVFAERLQSGLQAKGLIAKAVSLTHTHASARANVEALTDVLPTDAGRLHPRMAWALRRAVVEFEPDAVVAVGPTLRYAVLATAGRKTRLIYVAIGEPRYWIRNGVSRWIQRALLRRVDLVIAVSSMTKTQLLLLEPSLTGRIEVAHTGVPEALFQLARLPREDALRVVVIGALSAEKDPVAAVTAIAQLGDAKLRIVGSGPLEQDVVKAAQPLAAARRFELVGSVDDVSPHLAWADVLLLTSRTEGLPGAVLEAGAVGVVTVAYDVGGVREAVVDGVTGFVVPSGDQASLIRALESLSADRDLLERLSSAARIHIHESFELDSVTEDYVRLVTANMTRLRGSR